MVHFKGYGMTRFQGIACRMRHFIFVAGVLFTVAGIVWAILPFFSSLEDFAGLFGSVLILNAFAVDDEVFYGINLALVLGLVLLAQWAFLRPGKGFTVRMATVGRPLKSSVFVAGLMATLLTTGFIALLLELPDWWQPLLGDKKDGFYVSSSFIIWAVMLVLWAVWTWVFFVYWRQGDRYTQLGKMIRGLVAGSILEAIVAVPVHIWASRQRECYCCRGTYTTLVLAATVLIWAFGPGIILLYMREKRRRLESMQLE